MKKLGKAFVFGFAMAVGFLSGKVEAQDIATGNVNLRSGPGIGYSRLTTIPRGAPVRILGCQSNGWCDVVFGSDRGWASGRYLQHTQPNVYGDYPTVSVWAEPRTYRIIRRTPVVVVAPQAYAPIVMPYGYPVPRSIYPYYNGVVGWY